MKNKVLGNWNVFDICLLSLSMIAICLCSVFSPNFNILSVIVSVIGIIYVIFTEKKLLISPTLGCLYISLYAVVSYQQNFFGEAITNMFLALPIEFASIFIWFKHKSEQEGTIKTNKINWKEIICVIFGGLTASVGFYFMLRALNTEQLIINTISMVLNITACYLKFRRCPYYSLVYCLNSSLCLTLWILTTINSGLSFLPMVINFAVLTILNIYAFLNWTKKKA